MLICNLNDRNFGCAILFALDEMAGPGSQVEIFCSLAEEELQEILQNAQRRQERQFENIEVSKVYAMTSASSWRMPLPAWTEQMSKPWPWYFKCSRSSRTETLRRSFSPWSKFAPELQRNSCQG